VFIWEGKVWNLRWRERERERERERSPLALYDSLRSNWETVRRYRIMCRGRKERNDVVEMVRSKNNHMICSVCRKEEGSSHMLRCEGTKDLEGPDFGEGL
jgi:hypothetical protein